MVDKTQTQTEQTIDKVQKAETLDDLDALEQDINAEDTEPDTGGNDTDIDGNDNPDNNPGEKPKDQPTEPANKSKDKKEKTAISDEQRKKFDIPEKFKYWEDVVAWGSESEKAKNKYDIEKQQAINEKEQAINEREQYKSEIKKLREQLEQAGNSQASQQELVKEFNELFIEDPIKAIKKVARIAKSLGLGWGGDWKNPVDTPHLYLKKWGSTTSKLRKKYGVPDNFKKDWKRKVKGKSRLYRSKDMNKKKVKCWIPKGKTVEVLWYSKLGIAKVKYDGKIGFVFRSRFKKN